MDPELFRSLGGGSLAERTPRRRVKTGRVVDKQTSNRQQRQAKRKAAKRARY